MQRLASQMGSFRAPNLSPFHRFAALGRSRQAGKPDLRRLAFTDPALLGTIAPRIDRFRAAREAKSAAVPRKGTPEVTEDPEPYQQGVLNVKNFLFLATSVATLLVWECSLGLAQAPRPALPPPTVAIIDLNRIFKDLVRFKAMSEQMKADVEQAEAAVKGEGAELQKLADQLKEMKPGSPDYKALDENLTTRNAQLTARIRTQRTEFQQREAQIMYTIYREISDEIKNFAVHNGINLVLRFNGEPPDVNVPQDVLREVNKPVVYYNAQIDITQYILDSLNRRGGGVSPAAARAPVGVPGQRR